MTDIEIEKLADAIVRKLPHTVSDEDLGDRIEDILTEKVSAVVRRLFTRVNEALDEFVKEL